ncbi:flavin reductase family protein [Natrialbaceae archaeon A-arb3/5]
MNASTDSLDADECARIMKSVVAPRPIAWISTTSEDGVDNLAPFSSYNYISSATPTVMFSSSFGDGGEKKDTPRNALETEEFAVNVATESLLEEMDATSASLESDESEFDFAEVERAPCETIVPPRVADAPVTMECSLYDSLRIHDRLVVLGEIEHFHIDDAVLTDEGKIDATKLDLVARMGGPHYTGSDPIPFERQF